MDLTEEQIRELDELSEKATPGPWYIHTHPESEPIISTHEGPPRERVLARDPREPEGRLIVAMRNALPALLRGYREYRKNRAVVQAAEELRASALWAHMQGCLVDNARIQAICAALDARGKP